MVGIKGERLPKTYETLQKPRKPAAKMGGWCEEISMKDRAGGKVERTVQQQGAMERHTNVMETAE